jgi:uncharacterized protein YfaS (alpha-2-macroglobulin family)
MRSFRYMLLLALLLVIAGCRDHKETVPPEIAEILGLGIDRPLEVVLASPQGETAGPRDYEAVTVVFNQPMKALSAEAPEIEQPFTIEPEANGRFRWKGTATVSFIPNQPLRFGTEYKVTVPAGLTAASGQKLAKDYTFSFATSGPRVINTLPGNNSESFVNGDPIVLGFDQTVDAAKVGRLLTFSEPEGTPPPRVRAMTEDEAAKLNKERGNEPPFVARRSVVVEPQKPFEQGTTYSLRLAEGLVGEVGPRPSGRDYRLAFTTLLPFKWTGQSKYSEQSPESGLSFQFSTDVSYKQLKAHLKISPNVAVASSDYDDEMQYTEPTLYLDLQPNTTYTVSLDKELQDVHGQRLGHDVTFSWATGDLEPYAQMAEGIAILEARGKLSIPMGLQNIDKQTIKMAVLDRSEAVRLASMESYEWMWGDQGFRPRGGFGVNRTFKPKGARNQMHDSPLDLTEVLKGRKYGWVYYEVDSHGGKDDFHHRGLAQVTNLGATGKFSPENSLFVSTALDSGKILPGVEAIVTDGSGQQVWKGTTGADGRVEAPGWEELLGRQADRYDSPPLTLFLRQGEDQVFIRNGSFGSVWASRFDIDTRWSSSAHQPAAQVYTERGLYLPGEEVQLRGAMRDRSKGHWVNPDLKALDYELFNSRDESVEKGTVALNAFGTFHHTLKIAANSPSGAYRVDYKLPESKARSWNVSPELTGVSFRVEEFQPADFKVEVKSPLSASAMGGDLSFEVLGNWLFGSPMNAEKVEWSSYVEPATYSNEAYPNYDFGPLPLDNEEDSDRHQTLSSGKGLTDNQGSFKGQLSLQGIAYKGDANLTVEATIASTNRRSITNRLVVPLSRGAFRIGLLPSTHFAQDGKEVGVRAVTLTPDGKPVGGKSIKLELLRREWNSVRKTAADGSFHWVTEVEDRPVESREVETTESPQDETFRPKESGYHVLRATARDDAGNVILSETGFYSEGDDYVAWGRSDGDQMELVADKPKYKPGETAHILVKSPYKEATALVTYERELILHSYTTTLKGSSPIIDVPLTEDHLPNLYVSVMLLRGRVASEADKPDLDTGKPAFKIGYVDLPVVPDSKRLKVEVSTDKPRYGPGEEVVTHLKVTDQSGKPVQAELSLTAADVGVLNLIDYQTPDFFNTFYSSLPLAVRTAESRLDVIGQRSYGAKGENSGGGGGYNPGYRSDFRLTAVWKPEVLTDASGQAEVRFKLPENLTTFRVMATAIDKDTRCGKAESEIILTKPLILKPSAPAFARLGDEFQAGVLAVNGTDADHTLKVTMTAEGIDSKPEPQEIFLKKGEEREILFSMTASKEGTAVLRFDGSLDNDRDALQVEIPLKESTQRTTLASAGSTTETAVKETAKVPSTALEGSAQLRVSLAPTILNGLQSSIEELVDYPYGCLEQRLSRITPLLFTDDLVARFGLTGWHDGKAHAAVQSNLNMFADYQDESGGMKVWPDSIDPSPYLTALAVRTADLATERGYTVGDSWLPEARNYLKSYLDNPDNKLLDYNETETLVTRAAALEALTRYDFDGRSYLNSLMDRRDKMSAVGKAYLLQAAHRMKVPESEKLLATELINALKIENATAYFDVDETTTPWLYSDDVHDTGTVLAAMLECEQKLPVADKVVTWLLEARNRAGTWGTTSDNAAALSAMWAYSQAFEGKKTPTFTVSGTVGSEKLKTVEFAGGKLAQAEQVVPLKPGDIPIELSKNGDGRLYYNLSVSYRDKKPSPARDEGMTVLRAITSLDGKPVSEIRGGQIYKVCLSVVSPDLRRFVVLEDPVPAGLSVVKTDFATESSQLASLLKSSGAAGSWQTFFRFESYNDRILLFADALAPGEHYYEYLVRAQTPGTYLHPAAQVEEMYHPEVFGRTSTGTLTVVK